MPKQLYDISRGKETLESSKVQHSTRDPGWPLLGFLMSNPVNSVEFPGQKLLPYSLGILQICVVLTLQQVTTSENQLKKSEKNDT